MKKRSKQKVPYETLVAEYEKWCDLPGNTPDGFAKKMNISSSTLYNAYAALGKKPPRERKATELFETVARYVMDGEKHDYIAYKCHTSPQMVSYIKRKMREMNLPVGNSTYNSSREKGIFECRACKAMVRFSVYAGQFRYCPACGREIIEQKGE